MKRIFTFFLLSISLMVLVSCNGDEKITITFDSNGGTAVEQIIIDADTTTIDLPQTTKEGFNFEGWFFDEDLTSAFSIAGLLTNQNPTLYAKWGTGEEVTYTITFDTNGGSEIAPIVISQGATITRPDDPTKEGYNFAGWYLDQGFATPYPFASLPDEDITLYASWESAEVTIYFWSEGGSSVDSITGYPGTDVTRPADPTRQGYTFDGWFKHEENVAYEFATMPDANITLIARWSIISYTISFDTNGGTLVDSVECDYLGMITEPTAPTKEGYIFDGWYSDELFSRLHQFDSDKVVGDMTLYAKWVHFTTITFDSNGGSDVAAINMEAGADLASGLMSSTKEGYTFAGWYIDEALNTPFTSEEMPDEDMTVYAKWEPGISSVTVYTYVEDLDGQSFDLILTTIMTDLVTDSTYTYTPRNTLGFTFDSDNELNVLEVIVNADRSSIVKAYYLRNTITISFQTNGGSEVLPYEVPYQGDVSNMPQPIRSGYDFVGWYLDSQLNNIFDETDFPVEDITLYAGWDIAQSKLIFDSMGGDQVDDIVAYSGDYITLPVPEKEGYDFIAWYDSVDFDSIFDSTVMPEGSTTLYAKWGPKTYNLTYEENNGSQVLDETHAYMEAISAPVNPTKTDFIFGGWYSDSLLENIFVFGMMPAEDVVLYAKWIDASDANSIEVIMANPEYTNVTISGIVYAEKGSSYYGFYIYDETGFVFVEGDQYIVEPNDLVTLDGTIDSDGYVKYISSATNITVDETNQTEKTAKDLSIEEVASLTSAQPFMIHDLYTAEAILRLGAQTYELLDMQSFDKVLMEKDSYWSNLEDGLRANVDERITFTYTLEYNRGVYEIGIVDYEVNPLTEQEKVDLYMDLFRDLEFEPYYLEESEFRLPIFEDLGYVDSMFIAVGDNAQYFDQTNGRFLSIDEDQIVIQFELTFTSHMDSNVTETLTIDINVKALESDNIIDLLNGPVGASYVIDAIVVATSIDYTQMMVLKDATGSVLAEYRGYLEIGDRVSVRATKHMVGNQVYLTYEDDGLEIVKKIATEKDLGLSPIVMTLEELAALDLTDPSIYGKYIEVRGFFIPTYSDYSLTPSSYDAKGVDSMIESSKLVVGDFEIEIECFTENANSKLEAYDYLEVIMRGFLSEGESGFKLLYQGIREDLKIPDHSDQELVDSVRQSFIYAFEDLEVSSFSHFELAPYHEVVGTTFTWDLTETAETYYDRENQEFTYSHEDVDIEMMVTITKGSAEATYTMHKVLEQIDVKTVDQLISFDAKGSQFVQGYIAYWHPNFSYIMSETGKMIVISDHLEGARKGDEVIIYANWSQYNGMVALNEIYDRDQMLVEVLSSDNDIVNTYDLTDVKTIIESEVIDLNLYNKWISLQGTVNVSGNDIYLETEDGRLIFDWPDEITQHELKQFDGQTVRVRGVTGKQDYEGFHLIYVGMEDDILAVTYTDQQKADIAKQFIQDQFAQPLEDSRNFDFRAAEDLFDGQSIIVAYMGLDDNFDILDINGGYINYVTESTAISVAVLVTCNDISEPFQVLVTVVPYLEVPIVDEAPDYEDIQDAVLDLTVEHTIYAKVLAEANAEDGFVFLVEDATGAMRINLSSDIVYYYHYYVGEVLYFTGMIDVDNGYYHMEATALYDDDDYENVNPTFIPYTLEDINDLDPLDPTVYAKPVILSGMLEIEYEDFIATYYIVNDTQRVLIETKNAYWSEMIQYEDFQVIMYGFVYGPNEATTVADMSILVTENTMYDSEYWISLDGYTDEEIVDLAIEEMIDEYNLYKVVQQEGDPLNYPGIPYFLIDNYPELEQDNSVIEGDEFLVYDTYWDEYLYGYTTEDQIIKVNVEVTLNQITKNVVFEYELNGYVYSSLDDLFTVENGTEEIVLDAIVIQQGETHYYFLIEGKVFYLDTYLRSWIGPGAGVNIFGKKQVIDGVADYTYEIYLKEKDYVGFSLDAEYVTIAELYRNDYETNPLQESYLYIYGEVGYDAYLNMYTLTDQGKTVYLRNYYGPHNQYLEDYLDYFVYQGVYLPYGSYIRDEYLIVDCNNNSLPQLMDLTDEEELNQLAKVIKRNYDGKTYLSGEPLNFIIEPAYYMSHVVYETVDPLDEVYFDATYNRINIVDQAVDVQIRARVINSLDHSQFKEVEFTITILPKEDVAIRDAYRMQSGDMAHTTGIVTDVFYYNDFIDWLVIDDGHDEIIAYVDNMYLFNYEDADVSIGDEVRIVGSIATRDGVTPYIDQTYAIKVVAEDQNLVKVAEAYTFEDIINLDYLALDNVLTYVKITGELYEYSNGRLSILSDSYFVYGSYDTEPYEIMLDPLNNIEIYGDISGDIGSSVEVEGYLWLETTYGEFSWKLTYINHIVVTP